MTRSVSVPSKLGAVSLPQRYQEPWKQPFDDRVRAALRPGIRILDVGSGRSPAIPLDQRPEGCTYVGLDISQSELCTAPEGSYDEMYVADIGDRCPSLAGSFNLVVSWQVLEHVKSLDEALANMYSYLVEGGHMVAQFSGAFSAFGLVNRVVPAGLGVWLLRTFHSRDPETVFPAYYHHCWYGAITRVTSRWKHVEIVSRYRAGTYLKFIPLLQRAFLWFENWAESGNHFNLASHYIVDAQR